MTNDKDSAVIADAEERMFGERHPSQIKGNCPTCGMALRQPTQSDVAREQAASVLQDFIRNIETKVYYVEDFHPDLIDRLRAAFNFPALQEQSK